MWLGSWIHFSKCTVSSKPPVPPDKTTSKTLRLHEIFFNFQYKCAEVRQSPILK